MVRTSTARIGLGVAAVALAVAGTIATSPSASAAKPDTTCQRAGIATLQGAGLLDDVARDGLPISLAVGLGVTPRPSTDITTVTGTIRSDLQGAGQPQEGQDHIEVRAKTVSGDIALSEV